MRQVRALVIIDPLRTVDPNGWRRNQRLEYPLLEYPSDFPPYVRDQECSCP